MLHVIKGGLRRCCMLLWVETMLHVIKGGLRRCCMLLLRRSASLLLLVSLLRVD